MSVYYRYKKTIGGFRSLVELMEVTPLSRRQKMIAVGNQEDPEYTQKVLNSIMTFEDIIQASDQELMEILHKVNNVMIIGYAINGLTEAVQLRFLKLSPVKLDSDIKLTTEHPIGNLEKTSAQFKLIVAARELERRGFVKIKKIA